MNFDIVYFMFSFIFSGIGFIYFNYGRKQAKIPLIIIGMVLMIYPYFFESRFWLISIGLVLSLIPRFI